MIMIGGAAFCCCVIIVVIIAVVMNNNNNKTTPSQAAYVPPYVPTASPSPAIWNCTKNSQLQGIISQNSLTSSNVNNDSNGAHWACSQWVPACNNYACDANLLNNLSSVKDQSGVWHSADLK